MAHESATTGKRWYALEQKKGFTLVELLIVVAIIVILVAVAIPIFTSQIEKSREATDAANIRNAYAELITKVITEDTADSIEVTLNQKKDDWQINIDFPCDEIGNPKADGKATVSYENGKAVIRYSDSHSGGGSGKDTLDTIRANATPYHKPDNPGNTKSQRGTVYTDQGKYYIVDVEKPLKDFKVTLEERQHGIREVHFDDVREVEDIQEDINDLSQGCILHDKSTGQYYVYTGSNQSLDTQDQRKRYLIALN